MEVPDWEDDAKELAEELLRRLHEPAALTLAKLEGLLLSDARLLKELFKELDCEMLPLELTRELAEKLEDCETEAELECTVTVASPETLTEGETLTEPEEETVRLSGGIGGTELESLAEAELLKVGAEDHEALPDAELRAEAVDSRDCEVLSVKRALRVGCWDTALLAELDKVELALFDFTV